MGNSSGSFQSVSPLNPTSYLNQNEDQNVLKVVAQTSPSSTDKQFVVGTIWIDQPNSQSYQLVKVVNGTPTWTLLGPGASDVDTLTADSGGPISPAGGTITIAGGTNITTAGAGSTITLNLDDAITVATSVTSALLNIDNIEIDGNTISSTDTNGNINLSPDGTGVVASSKMDINGGNIDGTVIGAATPAAATFTTSTHDRIDVTGGAATDFIGQATLVAGTVTVANTSIAATDRIFLSRSALNGSTAIGMPVTAISAATSFTITSVDPATPANTETNDVSTFDYFIVRQA
jgi:hypothetical protein